MFLTLTFPQAEAPDEDGAHICWRKLGRFGIACPFNTAVASH
jgi:hypothetical protein